LSVNQHGDLYFTDPPFGLPNSFDDPHKELPFSGVYRLSSRGELTLLTRELRAPNGLAFSPDEKTLYISNADPHQALWMAYDVRPDGSLANGRVFFNATPWVQDRPGLPDGLKVDQHGNLFATGPGGIHIFAPDGTHLGSIHMAVPTGNVAWGEDGAVLYITADTALYRLRLSTKGAGF
jgi:gluconolactonase